jgi:dTMP kinase
MKRGKLVVIEGTDCSGKSTQINILKQNLTKANKTFTILDFPNYKTPTGKIVRRYLDGAFGPANEIPAKLASIFYAEDRYASKQFIFDALEEYDVVILDRYVESNMGHQGGKIRREIEREEFFEWLRELEYDNFNLPKPDAIMLLYMPYLVGQELMKKRERKSEFHPGADKLDGHEGNIEHLKNAEESYLHLARIYNWIQVNCAPSGLIDSLRTPEEISKEVWEKISVIFEDSKEEEFATERLSPDDNSDYDDDYNEEDPDMTPEEFCLCENFKHEITQEERKRILTIIEKLYGLESE